ncbi:MAG TPA: helix-turn-helix domain-containing protein [Polyangiales bacterium]|nr:helix-turn-helix domain-containing protein [Polyangiales bacterium]
MLRRKTDSPRGVLRSRPDRLPIQVGRFEPPEDLAPFVEHFWTVAWDLRSTGPHTQEMLPHPSLHWILEYPKSEIQGIPRGRFQCVLRGRSQLHAVKFRPGAFACFVSQPLCDFADRRVRALDVLGPSIRGLPRRLRDLPADDAFRELANALRELSPRPDAGARRAAEIVAGIAADREIVSVAQVCARWQLSPLGLQRLFRTKIGATPKWVIQRYRLHEIIERIHAEADAGGDSPPWAAWAAELGFTDQAHFARTFRAFVGTSPSQYVRRLRAPSPAAHAS